VLGLLAHWLNPIHASTPSISSSGRY
jgi:hypothetical protein